MSKREVFSGKGFLSSMAMKLLASLGCKASVKLDSAGALIVKAPDGTGLLLPVGGRTFAPLMFGRCSQPDCEVCRMMRQLAERN